MLFSVLERFQGPIMEYDRLKNESRKACYKLQTSYLKPIVISYMLSVYIFISNVGENSYMLCTIPVATCCEFMLSTKKNTWFNIYYILHRKWMLITNLLIPINWARGRKNEKTCLVLTIVQY